jgi:hypothetical protein
MSRSAAPAPTTGQLALNVALRAGFRIVGHGPSRGEYWHKLTHPDGRVLHVFTELGAGRLLRAQGYNRNRWNTTRLAVRSLPALTRLLDT